MSVSTEQPLMVVDDSDDDCEAVMRTLKREAGLANEILRFDNGADALRYLNREGPSGSEGDMPRPCLVLLDLNMPGMDGVDVLSRIKENPELNGLPVVILSSSIDESDVARCYDAGANTYVVKPLLQADFRVAMQNLKSFWIDTAQLPRLHTGSAA